MREINFRSWLSSGQQFTYFKNGEYSYFRKLDKLPVFNWDNAQLYTGLKDKNGVEIYESDIVTHDGYYGGDTYYNKGTFVIEFEDGAFNIDSAEIINNNIEAIGNIYQNKELLSP